jgi:4,5:9,10-diseco-3-hydroxy-5,9,17-trioxoandrosta-1(10),2-diene-4-oate hydrolase
MRRWETGAPEGSLRISVDGVDLAVDDRGAGQSVICLHAIAHGSADFDAFAARTAGRYRVIRIDWPGQGRSGADGVAPTPARYAALLRGVVVHLGIEDPVIVGCSIGGAAAVEYASRYSVRALVLANPGGLVTPSETVSRACRAMSRFFAAGASGAWWFGPAYRAYYRMVLPWPSAWRQRKRIVRAGYENAALLAAAWSTFADPHQADQRRAAIGLDVPVLFAWAMHDRINAFKASQDTIAGMKKARVEKFDGGHAAFLEQPRQFVAKFDRFIAEIGVAAQRAPSRPVAAAHALAQ